MGLASKKQIQPARATFPRLEDLVSQFEEPGEWVAVQLDIAKFSILNTVMGEASCDELINSIDQWLAVEPLFAWRRIGTDVWIGLRNCTMSNPLMAHVEWLHERINSQAARPICRNFRPHLAIGVAAGALTVDLLEGAAQACCHAKQGAKGVVKFSAAPAAERSLLIRALIEGKRINSYLQLAHQKIVHADGTHHYEILCRPKGFHISDMIAAVEGLGLATVFDTEIVRIAVEQIPPDWPLHAINLSTQTVCDANAITHIIDMIQERQNLAVEVTETVLMRSKEAAMDSISRLRKAGIDVYLDDYGEGATSFGMLDMPFSHLKLGANLSGGGCPLDVVRAIISLAAARGMSVIGENVESLEQYEKLREAGVTGFQGWYFHAPELLPDLR